MPVEPLNDQFQYRDGKLPIDRLRHGEMTDAEVVRVAAETLAYAAEGNADLIALATRLKLVRQLDPQQTRARSLYYPKPKPDGGRTHG